MWGPDKLIAELRKIVHSYRIATAGLMLKNQTALYLFQKHLVC